MSGQGPSVPASVPLALVRRAGAVESIHRGRYVLMRGSQVLAQGGDQHTPVYVRSTAKPLQGLIGVTSGAIDAFGLDERCFAIACGSHNGAEEHVAAVRRLLIAADIDEDHLACGGHWSIDAETARTQRLNGLGLPPIWSNCSGKHAMMLAAARALGAQTEGYLDPQHPVQAHILDTLAELTELPRGEIHFGIDGCGAPAPCLPLPTFARALLRLAELANSHEALARASQTVLSAMARYPELVAGARRFDTALMQASSDGLIAKAGAEGLHAVLVPARQLALLVKVEDGNDRGYIGFVIGILETLGVLSRDGAQALRQQHAPDVIRNHAGSQVGSLEAVLPDL